MSIPPPPDEKAAAWCTPLASWRDALNKTPTDKIIPTQTDCRHGFRLASTASRSCTQRADAAPAFAVDRSLSGRSRLGCSRRADLGLLRSKTAHGAAGLCVAAPAARSRPVVNGRTERRKIEAASSRRRWTLGPPRWIAAGVLVLPLSGALGPLSTAHAQCVVWRSHNGAMVHVITPPSRLQPSPLSPSKFTKRRPVGNWSDRCLALSPQPTAAP